MATGSRIRLNGLLILLTVPGHCPGTGPEALRAGSGQSADRASGALAASRSLAPIPVRYASVDPATQRPTALQGDTRRDKEETPRQHENSQLAGRLRRWWQVLGSNQRRLSRRFYSLPIPTHYNSP